MAEYAGEIRVKAKVDNSEIVHLEASMESAEEKAEDLQEAVKNVNVDKEAAVNAEQTAKSMDNLTRETKKASQAMKEFEAVSKTATIRTNDGNVYDWDGNLIQQAATATEIFEEKQSDLADTAERLAPRMHDLAEETRQVDQAARNVDVDSMEDSEALTPMKNTLAFIKKSFQDIPMLFGAVTGKFSEQTRQMEDEFISLTEAAKTYKHHLETLEEKGRGLGDSEYDRVYVQWQQAEQAVKDYKTSLLGTGKLHMNLSGGMQRVGKSISNTFRRMIASAKGFFASTRRGGQATNSIFKTMASRLKGLALSLLVFNWITKGFNAMVEGMKSGFKVLMKYSDDYAASVQSLKNSMSTLGNQFAATFAPIVQLAIPYLVQLINWINSAINAVAQLIASLSGKDTWTRATKVQAGYNEELDNTASSAKKALGALAKFDDLDVLQKRDDSDSAGGGAGSGAEGGFEEVPIDNKWKDIADWLREMWENSDFYELGQLLGEKLKDSLDNIPWDVIKESARNIAKSIATFINGFIEVEGLGYSIGNTLAQAFNTGFEFLNEFVHQFHWTSLGEFIAESLNGVFQNIDWPLITDTFLTGAKGLADAINSFVDTFDWDMISTTIANALNTLTQTISTFFDTVDWSDIGKNIGEQLMQTIEKIDWGSAGASLNSMAWALLDAIDAALEELDWIVIGESIRDFMTAIDWLPLMQEVGSIIADTLTGAIVAAFAALTGKDLIEIWKKNKAIDEVSTSNPYKSGERSSASWFELDIFNWDEAKEIFDQAGKDIGENLMLGVFEGITAGFLLVFEPIKDLFAEIVEGVKELLGIHSPSTVFYEIGMNLILGLFNGLSETWGTILEWWSGSKEWLLEVWEEIKTQTAEKFEQIKEKVSTAIENMKLSIQQKFGQIKLKVQEIGQKLVQFKNDASTAFNTLKTNVTNALQPIIDKVQGFIDKIKEAIQAIKDFLQSGFNKLSSIGTTIGGFFSGGGISLYSAAPAATSYSLDNVPALASGSVIRGGNPFLALLGDQPAGQTNVEAPLSTIEQAVENVMSRNGYGMGGAARIVLQLNGQDVGEAMLDDLLSVMNRRGLDVEVLGVT